MKNLVVLIVSSLFLSSCNNQAYLEERIEESRKLADKDKFEEAIEILDQLDKEYPNEIDVILDRAIFKSISGKEKESLKDYQKVLMLDPNNTLAYFNLGLSYSNLNRHKKAIENFDKAIKTKGSELAWRDSGMGSYNNPYDVEMKEIRFERGISRNETGELKGAFDDFSFCINGFYQTGECYVLRGCIYWEYDMKNEACQDLLEAYKYEVPYNVDSIITACSCTRK